MPDHQELPPRFTLQEVCDFLDGSAPLDGVWFEEDHPAERGGYWWRKHLRAALEASKRSAPAVSGEPVAERDCPKCGGSGTIHSMTSHLGPDDYDFDEDCPACNGTGSADLADAIDSLGWWEVKTDISRTLIERAAVLRIIKARAANPTGEVEKNAARLDWLQATGNSPWRMCHEEMRPSTSGLNHYERVTVFDGWSADGTEASIKPTIREAIDQAMNTEAASAVSYRGQDGKVWYRPVSEGVFPPDLATLHVEQCGQQYTPSNGTEGECFFSFWCSRCERDKVMNGTVCHADAGDDDMCQILGASFAGEAKEWVYGQDGQPMCTAFVPMGEKPHERCEHTQDLF